MRKPIIDWAKEYCGDPASHLNRGTKIRDLLVGEGLKPEHRVLDVGCGALSQGKPLIEYLNPGNYVGLDPNGWLVEAALDEWPQLLSRSPSFAYSTDFSVSEGTFDYIIAHSVISHIAQWQLEQALVNIHQSAKEGARWYASLRIDQYDAFPRFWVYPGVSYFRFRTLQVLGWHAGWWVDQIPSWKDELVTVAPNDFHDWVRMTAIPSPESMNRLRLEDEKDRGRDTEIMKIAKATYEQVEADRIKELENDWSVNSVR